MSRSKISTLVFSAGNVFIAVTLIALVYMTRQKMPKVDELKPIVLSIHISSTLKLLLLEFF